MATTWIHPKGSGEGARARPQVDEMLARYVDWREDAAAVTDACKRWCTAPTGERAWRFSAYMAALEQEGSAATSHASVVTDLYRSSQSNPTTVMSL